MKTDSLCGVNPEEQVFPVELEQYAKTLEAEAERARELAEELRRAMRDYAVGNLAASKCDGSHSAMEEFHALANCWGIKSGSALIRFLRDNLPEEDLPDNYRLASDSTVRRFWEDPTGCSGATRQRVLFELKCALARRTGKVRPSEVMATSSELAELEEWTIRHFETAQVALQTGNATIRFDGVSDIPTYEQVLEARRRQPYYGHRRDKALCAIARNLQTLNSDELSAIATLTDSIAISRESR